jgi:hypothetical protein
MLVDSRIASEGCTRFKSLPGGYDEKTSYISIMCFDFYDFRLYRVRVD